MSIATVITQDEIRSQSARFLNAEINANWNIHLVTCPQCGTILCHEPDLPGDTEIVCHCCSKFQNDKSIGRYQIGECPDFFH